MLLRPSVWNGGGALDEPEIREFLRVEYPRLVAAVAVVAGSFAAAEDAVQEALLKAWERTDRGQSIESLNSWVITVALNHTRSTIRRAISERRARRRLAARSSVAPRSELENVDLKRAIALLPRRQREVVVLRYLLEMNTQEAAGTLGVSEGTVKSSLARARATLARELRLQDLEEADEHGEHR